ncbi:MAG: hypothetical protein ACKOAG_10840, partial [Candidatus Kapaibacterium sp.]
VVAESTFPIRKEKSQLERDIDEARSAVPFVFVPVKRHVDETQTAVDETQTAVELDELLREFGSLEAPTRDAFRALVRELRQKDMTSVPLIGLPGSSVDIAETGTIVRRTPVSDLLDSARIRAEIANTVQSVGAPEAVDVIERRVLAIVQPTLILDMKRTQRMQEAAEASVSRTTGLVRKGEVLVSKGEVLTEE